MEYDKATGSGTSEAHSYPHSSDTGSNGYGRMRVKGNKVDTDVLAQSLTFPFSGCVAPNRFLKAPMTERLCTWNTDGQEIV